MAWRLAKSLEVLREEANQAAPGRSKVSDGTIGDAAHTSRTSDHNPDSAGVVAALDLTHDPVHGADMHVWAERVRLSNHPALKYIIWNRHISSRGVDGFTRWRVYNGTNPHTAHMHVSVERSHYDDTRPWGIMEDDMPLTDNDKQWIHSEVRAPLDSYLRALWRDGEKERGAVYEALNAKLDVVIAKLDEMRNQ